ncbi:putative protein involved in cytokinesis, contains TGc (transglutaminase/protease-like) domain [Sedimentisphaera cyanobacteriorum]|uniref:DUF3857 domain-containing protein n=1 Tax=Sedimentisphaera cyanobacteriorum TaxID=1940790 RepID=A0A1Q2HMH2_9BACT|nr:DUF3857 domain-containing protein [Sedimentisphaera cyanobacteriorum]AQQ08667.1 putative protein involved in cytokinesis, contains TGc (transglutaminase/protease-like) domain [Sedimentisphaera cyanobacteriorum]
MHKKVMLFLLLAIAASSFSEVLIYRPEAMAATKEADKEKYPNSDEVLVSGYTKTTYNPDGTSVDISEYYKKILTEKGKRNNQTITFHFTRPYDTIELELVELIKPDGTAVEIDTEANSKVMTDNSSMSSNIYNPNSKLLVVSLPGLEVGDTIHYIAADRYTKVRMKNTWSNYFIFESKYPIVKEVYEVYASKELPIQSIALKDKVDETVSYEKTEKSNHTVHKWTARNVPRFYPESSMPDYWTCVQRLLVSTIDKWEEVSKWYWDLSKPHFDTTPEMEEKVEELTKGLETEDEKIRAIFKFVSQEIRYMGITIEKEAPGNEPHDVSLTFENRHGVCRDKAALLVAMLRLAGFESYPVLIHSGPKKDKEVPQPYFNHAITCVRNEDGTYKLMDSTDESTQRLMPSYLNDCSYIVAAPYGETLLESPVEPAENNMLKIITKAQIDKNGSYKAESTLVFEGINDNAYRGAFLRKKPEQRKSYFEKLLKNFLPGGELDSYSLKPENLQDTSKNLRAEISYHADNVLINGKGKALLPIYNIGAKAGIANFVLQATGLDERRFPLETGITCGVSESKELRIAEELKIFSTPETSAIDEDYMSYSSNFEKTGSGVNINREIKFKEVLFSPEQYLKLKENLKEIEYNSRKKIVLEDTQKKEQDSELLSKDVEYNLKDEHNWTVETVVRRKILSYKGKKDFSELKFSYVPVWEELELNYARVINDGNVKEISEVEKNVMDAGWVASAPQYPEGKTLVASLPGVEAGSVIEYSVKRTLKNRPYFSMYRTFQGYEPHRRMTVKLNIPSNIETQIVCDDNGILNPGTVSGAGIIERKSSENAGIKTYVWTAEDIPALKAESSLPPKYAYTPFLRVSTGQIGEYADMVSIAAASRVASQEERVSEKAKEITKGAKSEKEIITAIRDFAARNIRTAGPSYNRIPLGKHFTCTQTLENGYGNRLDKAILTSKLLELSGIENEIILPANCGRLDEFEELMKNTVSPSLWGFPLVKTLTDKGVFYIGDTTQYAELGTSYRNRRLSINTETRRLLRIDLPEEYTNRADSLIELEITAEGKAEMLHESRIWGTNFGESNKYFSEATPEERRRYYEKLVSNISQFAEAESELVTDFSAYPGLKQYELDIPKYAVKEGRLMYFTVPANPGSIGISEDVRENPYYMSGYSKAEITVNTAIPENMEVLMMPKSEKRVLPADAGVIEIECSQRGGMITISYSLETKPAVIRKFEYDRLSEIDSWLKHPDKRTITLIKSEE